MAPKLGRAPFLVPLAAMALVPIGVRAETQPLAFLPARDGHPARVELRVDGHLVTRVSCDGPRTLKFAFPKDSAYRTLLASERRKPLELELEPGRTYRLATTDTPQDRTGRLALDAQVTRDLERARLGSFWGPNEMGEPWVMENLGALRRLARSCPR